MPSDNIFNIEDSWLQNTELSISFNQQGELRCELAAQQWALIKSFHSAAVRVCARKLTFALNIARGTNIVATE